MRYNLPYSQRHGAFTLLEILVVMAIMAIVLAFSRLALVGLSSSGKFNASLSDVSGILEQGRAYAIAQDTYVWVAFYEYTPASGGPLEVYAGAFASSDGTDPFNWAGSKNVPSAGISSITRLYHFKGLHLQTTSLPNATGILNFPVAAPVFQCTAQSDAGQITLPGSGAVYWVIQFTPTGAARNGPNPIESIWLGMQPSLSKTAMDTHNIASLKVNGFTGLTTIYRQ